MLAGVHRVPPAPHMFCPHLGGLRTDLGVIDPAGDCLYIRNGFFECCPARAILHKLKNVWR